MSLRGAVAATLLGILSTPVWGIPTLTAVGQGDGRYELLGEGLEGIGGVAMTLSHDGANPNVTLGGLFAGAIMAPNLTVPGVVKIGIISPNRLGVSGKGSIVTLTLSPVAGIQGTVTTFTAQLVSAAGGGAVPAVTRIMGAADTAATTAGGSGTSATFTPMATSVATVIAIGSGGGGVTSQGSTTSAGLGNVAISMASGAGRQPSPPPEAKPGVPEIEANIPPLSPEAPVAAPEELRAPPTVVAGTQTLPPVVLRRSVRELFRDYGGERNPAALATLFTSEKNAGVRQEPAIALSDGNSTVSVSLSVPPGVRAPTFALQGAKLVSLGSDGDLYVFELRPQVGVNEVKITIMNNGVVSGVPLVVAQPLAPDFISGEILNESAVALYLKGAPGKRKSNGGDPWLDDYIVMANYLAGKGTSPTKISTKREAESDKK